MLFFLNHVILPKLHLNIYETLKTLQTGTCFHSKAGDGRVWGCLVHFNVLMHFHYLFQF